MGVIHPGKWPPIGGRNREHLERGKKLTAPSVPKWSPTSVLTGPDRALLLKSDGFRCIPGSMAVSERIVFQRRCSPPPAPQRRGNANSGKPTSLFFPIRFQLIEFKFKAREFNSIQFNSVEGPLNGSYGRLWAVMVKKMVYTEFGGHGRS